MSQEHESCCHFIWKHVMYYKVNDKCIAIVIIKDYLNRSFLFVSSITVGWYCLKGVQKHFRSSTMKILLTYGSLCWQLYV